MEDGRDKVTYNSIRIFKELNKEKNISSSYRSYGANRLLNLQGSKFNYVKLALSSRGSVHEKHNPRTIGSKAQHAKLI